MFEQNGACFTKDANGHLCPISQESDAFFIECIIAGIDEGDLKCANTNPAYYYALTLEQGKIVPLPLASPATKSAVRESLTALLVNG